MLKRKQRENYIERCKTLLQPALNQGLLTWSNLDYIEDYSESSRKTLRNEAEYANELLQIFKTTHDMVVYHGVFKNNKYVNKLVKGKVGDVILLNDFIPTSRRRRIVNWFCRQSNTNGPGIYDGERLINLVLQFELPTGFPHLPVSNLLTGSAFHLDRKYESEILLPRNLKFKIKSITKNNGLRTITLVPNNSFNPTQDTQRTPNNKQNWQNQQNPPHKRPKVEPSNAAGFVFKPGTGRSVARLAEGAAPRH